MNDPWSSCNAGFVSCVFSSDHCKLVLIGGNSFEYEEDIEVAEVSKSSLPDTSLSDKAAVVGKYATTNLFAGDFATTAKLSDNANSAADVLSKLKGDKVAMSVTINSFAGGLSGKLENGDIVSICVTDKAGKTSIPGELKYVKVITTTTKGGIDENDVVENEDGSYELPSTITVLVSEKQAVVLASNEENAAMHVALVYRGDDASAQKFLDSQDSYLSKTADAGGAVNE